MKTIIIATALTIFTATAFASETKCKSGSDERSLKISDVQGGCNLDYTKAGSTSSVATQKQGQAKCEEVRAKIKEKLTASGYQCEESAQ
jgi:hypothetical protein